MPLLLMCRGWGRRSRAHGGQRNRSEQLRLRNARRLCCWASGCPYSPDGGALRPGDGFSTARGKPASWPSHGWRLGTIPPLLPWSKERHLIRLRLRPPCSQSPEHLLHFVFHRPRSQSQRIAGKWAIARWPLESHRPPQILRQPHRAAVALKNWAVSSAGRAGDS